MTMQEKIQIAAEMRSRGQRLREIARKLGVCVSMAHSYVEGAKAQGILPSRNRPIKETTLRMIVRSRGIDFGKWASVIEKLNPEVQNWLIDQVPQGSNLAEMVAAIITDAYHDENGD